MVERGERFVVERDGVDVAVIQPPIRPTGPTLRELSAFLADVPWPDAEYFADLAAIRDEANVEVESPRLPAARS